MKFYIRSKIIILLFFIITSIVSFSQIDSTIQSQDTATIPHADSIQTDSIKQGITNHSEVTEDSNESKLFPFWYIVFGIFQLTNTILLIFFLVDKKKKNKEIEETENKNQNNTLKDVHLVQMNYLKQLSTNFDSKVDAQQTKIISILNQLVKINEEITRIKKIDFSDSNNTSQMPQKQNNGKTIVESYVMLYAKAYIENGNIVLSPVGEEYNNVVAFIITAKGDKGRYSFNAKALENNLHYAETQILPYCNYDIVNSSLPTNIVTEEEGTVVKQNNVWIVDRKAKIIIK